MLAKLGMMEYALNIVRMGVNGIAYEKFIQ
jgi:hypothetical protein